MIVLGVALCTVGIALIVGGMLSLTARVRRIEDILDDPGDLLDRLS